MGDYITSEMTILSAAREALREIQSRIGYSDLEDHGWKRDVQLTAQGRLAEAADAGEGAIFNVLNIAKNHCGVDVADYILYVQIAEVREEVTT